jgi:hypothetical protein
MQDTKKRGSFVTLAGLTLCITLAARLTSAQGPGGQDGNQGFGRQGRNAQGPGGGRGGFGGQMPFAMGTITAGDANTHSLTIQSQFGGSAQTIQIGVTTQMVTQQTVNIADLKVDDQVQVQGVPTGITASTITAGQMPTFLQGGGQGRFGGGPSGGTANNSNTGGQTANSRTAFASATGRVTSTSPLTISLGEGVSLTVKPGAKARVSRIASLTFNNLKVGDRVMAAGQAGNDGNFAATGIAVNMTMGGGMGPGGGGPGGGGPGGGGPGGPDGQGGPPPESGAPNGSNN